VSLLRTTQTILDSIRAHGEEAYPNECCGVLLADSTQKDRRIVASVRAGNARTDSAQNRYSISPLELIKIEREARQQGLEIAGFYHSHPDHPAQWSATDFAEAHWLGCSYMITAVVQGKATITNSFLLAGRNEEEKRFDPETVVIEER
jgi:proteasome lid subunit RPN8/RPN11